MWKSDNPSKLAKEREISKSIRHLVENEIDIDKEEHENLYNEIINSIDVAAPMHKEEEPLMTYTTVNFSPNGLNGGANYRLGNIRFNLKGILDSITDSAVAIVSAVTTPVMTPYVVSRVINNLFKFNPLKVEISNLEANIIYTLHLYQNKKEIDSNTLYDQLNIQLRNNNENVIERNDFDECIKHLMKLGILVRQGDGFKIKDILAFNYR